MKTLALWGLIASTSFAESGDFFKKTSPMIWEGLDSIRFGQTQEKVIKTLNDNLKTIEEYGKRYNVDKKLSIWVDSTSQIRMFNTNYVRRINHEIVNVAKTGKAYSDVSLERIGLKTVYVGNHDSNYVLMAFTFYNGSKEFSRGSSKSDYVESIPIKGLFSMTINMDGFKQEFLYHVLDEVGYGRPCFRFTFNCQDKDEDNAGGSIVTTDKDTKIYWRKDGDLLDIHLKANYVSYFPKACRTNFIKWVRSQEFKHPSLD